MLALRGARGFVTFVLVYEQVVVVFEAVRRLYGWALWAALILMVES